MKSLLITHKGCESIAAEELQEHVKTKTKVEKCVVMFEAEQEILCNLCYKMQSITRAMHLITNFDFDSLEDIVEKIKAIDFSKYLIDKTYAIECIRKGEHDFNSSEIKIECGPVVFKNSKAKVDMKNPQISLLFYINENKCYVGVDYAGFDLGKRLYRVAPSRIKSSMAFALLKFAEFTDDKKVLDPFMHTGVIMIEAALHKIKRSPHFFDKKRFVFNKFLEKEKINFNDEQIDSQEKTLFGLDFSGRNVRNSEKNAKAAGVLDALDLKLGSINDLGEMFDNVDLVVSFPPSITKTKQKIGMLYQKLFENAKHILSADGRIVLLSTTHDDVVKIAKEQGFEVKKEKEVWQGHQKMWMLLF